MVGETVNDAEVAASVTAEALPPAIFADPAPPNTGAETVIAVKAELYPVAQTRLVIFTVAVWPVHIVGVGDAILMPAVVMLGATVILTVLTIFVHGPLVMVAVYIIV